MDIIFLILSGGLLLATLGLIRACEWLGGR
jgi:hypothetical protein